jgi:hypothetical protein
MLRKQFIRPLCLFSGLLACALVAPNASAQPVGSFNITNAAGGGIILTSQNIDFALPVGGGFGNDVTGFGTSVLYTNGGPLLASASGSILDLAAGGGPVPDFMTFSTDPTLHFDLTTVGPGVANTVAAAVLDPNLPASSPFAGSPFILQPTATGTTITFSTGGIARDSSGINSTWSGLFTLQAPGVTPFQIQQTLLNGGDVISSYSAGFTVVVPEPGTSVLFVAGLIGVVAARRKLRR